MEDVCTFEGDITKGGKKKEKYLHCVDLISFLDFYTVMFRLSVVSSQSQNVTRVIGTNDPELPGSEATLDIRAFIFNCTVEIFLNPEIALHLLNSSYYVRTLLCA